MIIGIGTDIVDILRIEALLARHGTRFRARILHEDELSVPQSDTASFVAKRFAAKEAIAKALGTGIRGIVVFRDMIIDHDQLGRPVVRFVGALGQWIVSQGIRIHLSISDERTMAVAMAVAEKPVSIGGENQTVE